MAFRMDSVTTIKLPTIDFSMVDLSPGTSSWNILRGKVHKALEEYGCFEAVYDNMSLDLHKAMLDAMEDVFDLPLETKTKNTYEKPYFGYIGPRPGVPLLEGLGIDEPLDVEQVQRFTNLMWPDGNASFCKTVHSFANQVLELDQMVKRMVYESYGLEKYYGPHVVESTNYLLRIMKYKRTDSNESTLGIHSHTDKSFLTIIHQNEVKGLEVQTKDGGEWICHSPSSITSCLVLVGDAFMAWSNGRLHSPRHRVVMNGSGIRYSIQLFSFGKGIVETPEELVDEERPLQFKPFDQMGLIRFFITEEGRKAKSTVKAYCGV